jgi:transposase
VIEPESKSCPCCGGALHVIGEDVSKRLDRVPARLRVVVTRRPKYACGGCEKNGADDVAGVIQVPARLIMGGPPTEALVADVVVSKYADHLPLRRQAQILTPPGRGDRAFDAGPLGRRGGRQAAAAVRSSGSPAKGIIDASRASTCRFAVGVR